MSEEDPKNPPHRPPPSIEEMDEAFRKLEPYLKSGLSIRKAVIQAHLPKSTIYDWVEHYPYFSDKVEEAKVFFSLMMTNAVMRQMTAIVKKQENKEELTADDLGFIKWTAINSKATQEEFGSRIEHTVIDPEVELKKLMGLIDDVAEK